MLVVSFLFLICAALAAVDRSALPKSIAYNGEASTGPDGPWWYVTAAIGPLEESVGLFPGFSANTLVISKHACSAPGAQCPRSSNGSSMQTFDADEASSDARSKSANLQADAWAKQQANLLNVDGFGQIYAESMAFPTEDAADQPFLTSEENALVVSDNYTVRYPGGAFYTMSTGLLSLWSGASNVSWTASNGSSISRYRTLPAAYSQGHIPSLSFGIHVGSVNHNMKGSLVLGGYDRSRCITNPIVSDDTFVQLVDVSLAVAEGTSSSFIGLPRGHTDGLLRANGSGVGQLSLRPNPAVPYINLPRDTCDAIASHLPVTYSPEFNLYLWNVESPAYERIIKSAHYLSFTFAPGTGFTNTINVPFALLNLTLDTPLTQTPTPYFACSPWLPSAAPYNLGRAFLQAAFLAQNWQTGKLFLAQAPGPDYAAPNVRKIAATDNSLLGMTDPPDWLSTWSSVFEAQPEGSGNSPTDAAKSDESNDGPSTATIAGVAVGALVAVALIAAISLCWLRRRRRHRRAAAVTAQQDIVYGNAKVLPGDGGLSSRVESGAETVHEVAAEPRLVELPEKNVRESVPVELAAETPVRS